MPSEILEDLYEFAAQSIPSNKILEAKKQYQKETGEIFEDDKSFNTRMGLFLEWYLFDNYLPDKSKVLIEALIEENQPKWPKEKLEAFQNISTTIHSLFLVKAIKEKEVKILNLFSDEIYTVQEIDSQLIFRKNDIFQGRIISYKDQFCFTGNYCFHPLEVHKFIKPQIKLIKKIQNQHKKDLRKIEKLLHKENKILEKQVAKIEKINEKLSNTGSNKTRLNQKLSDLQNNKNDTSKVIQILEKDIVTLKVEKIKIDGNELINKLINKFAYMNLKWERSRQINASDIYSN